jgi:DNA-binding NarL/FixJ family response regulator
MTGLRVVICNDHRMMRDALVAYLGAQPGVASVTPTADADEAIRKVRRGGDVLVLDLRLAGGEGGLDVIEAMRNLGLAIPTLVIGDPRDLDLTAHALKLGALGYIPKTAQPTELYDAVVNVAAGRAFIPDGVLEPLLHRLLAGMRAAEQSQATLATLTARELEVLRLLTTGLRRQEIARRLGLSSNTVRTHLRHIMEKLGVTSQLAAAARRRQRVEAAESHRAPAEPPPQLNQHPHE